MSEIRSSERRRLSWTAALSAASIAVCLFGNLGAIGLVGPDEPRYAWIARAMAETRDWLTPRLFGQPWFEKPILYYWAAAAGFRLHLPDEWAARLPSAFAALAAAIAIGWLARKHYGGDANSLSAPALLAPLIFSTSIAAIGFARAATPDMLFSASLTLAMASAASVLRYSGALRAADSAPAISRVDWLPLTLFGVFLGLAALAKGPAAIILAGGAIGLWALATGQWHAATRVLHPFAISAFCLVALPWYALCAILNPDFLRVFFWQHNFERYTTPIFQHRQPFWYFGPIVLLALIPWTVLLWPVAREGVRLWREKRWTSSPGFFFACWALFPVLFFSASESKLPGYILPSIPPLALICAISIARACSDGRSKIKAVLSGIALTWVAVGIAGVVVLPRRAPNVHVQALGPIAASPAVIVATITMLVAIVLLVATLRSKAQNVLLLCGVLTAASVGIANLRFLPLLDLDVSARPHAEFMRNDLHPDRILTYRLKRSWVYGLAFYFRRELPEWSPADPNPALVLTTPEGLEQIRKLGRTSGELEETQPGLVYVPIAPAPVPR